MSQPHVLGFTGIRTRPTRPQRDTISEFVYGWDELHHGDCVGADSFAHFAFMGLARIVIHPPTDDTYRAFCTGGDTIELPPAPYMVRNQAIIDACEHLLAVVDGPERVRSGTWSTVRKARKARKPITIVWPDGHTETTTPPPDPETPTCSPPSPSSSTSTSSAPWP